MTGEERVIAQYLEYSANAGPSDSCVVGETVIDIDPPRFLTAPSSPYAGEECNSSSLNIDGVGGGGGPGGGGEPDGNGDNYGLSDDRNRRRRDELSLKKLHEALKKLAKMSIFIAAQTGTTLLFVTGSSPKSILHSIVVINVCSYLLCLFSFLVTESKPVVGSVIAGAGSLLAALGFFLTMCLIIPPEFICFLAVFVVLLFFSLSVLSFH